MKEGVVGAVAVFESVFVVDVVADEVMVGADVGEALSDDVVVGTGVLETVVPLDSD